MLEDPEPSLPAPASTASPKPEAPERIEIEAGGGVVAMRPVDFRRGHDGPTASVSLLDRNASEVLLLQYQSLCFFIGPSELRADLGFFDDIS